MLLIIDNYDSFTYNLYQYAGEVYKDIKVVRNDSIVADEIEKMNPCGIILSPGPGRPEDAGICVDVIKKYASSIPILGICLGHQAIGYAYGGNIVNAEIVKHGKTSVMYHNNNELFKDVESPITVMRYHSLVVDKDSLPEKLSITAQTEDGIIMGLKHRDYHVYGLQFHPESILTMQGKDIIKNFVEVICNATGSN